MCATPPSLRDLAHTSLFCLYRENDIRCVPGNKLGEWQIKTQMWHSRLASRETSSLSIWLQEEGLSKFRYFAPTRFSKLKNNYVDTVKSWQKIFKETFHFVMRNFSLRNLQIPQRKEGESSLTTSTENCSEFLLGIVSCFVVFLTRIAKGLTTLPFFASTFPVSDLRHFSLQRARVFFFAFLVFVFLFSIEWEKKGFAFLPLFSLFWIRSNGRKREEDDTHRNSYAWMQFFFSVCVYVHSWEWVEQ